MGQKDFTSALLCSPSYLRTEEPVNEHGIQKTARKLSSILEFSSRLNDAPNTVLLQLLTSLQRTVYHKQVDKREKDFAFRHIGWTGYYFYATRKMIVVPTVQLDRQTINDRLSGKTPKEDDVTGQPKKKGNRKFFIAF